MSDIDNPVVFRNDRSGTFNQGETMEAPKSGASVTERRLNTLVYVCLMVATQLVIARILLDFLNAHAETPEQMIDAFDVLKKTLFLQFLLFWVYAACADTIWHGFDLDLRAAIKPWGGTLSFQTGLFLFIRLHADRPDSGYLLVHLPLDQGAYLAILLVVTGLGGALLLMAPFLSDPPSSEEDV